MREQPYYVFSPPTNSSRLSRHPCLPSLTAPTRPSTQHRMAEHDEEEARTPSFARSTTQSARRRKQKASPDLFSAVDRVEESGRGVAMARAKSGRAMWRVASARAAVDSPGDEAAGTRTGPGGAALDLTRVRQRLLNHIGELHAGRAAGPRGSQGPAAGRILEAVMREQQRDGVEATDGGEKRGEGDARAPQYQRSTSASQSKASVSLRATGRNCHGVPCIGQG